MDKIQSIEVVNLKKSRLQFMSLRCRSKSCSWKIRGGFVCFLGRSFSASPVYEVFLGQRCIDCFVQLLRLLCHVSWKAANDRTHPVAMNSGLSSGTKQAGFFRRSQAWIKFRVLRW